MCDPNEVTHDVIRTVSVEQAGKWLDEPIGLLKPPTEAERIKDHEELIRTGPGHPDYPHEVRRIPRSLWNEAEKAATTNQRPTPVAQRFELKWVGVDLDGTLAAPLWTPSNPTSEIGDPIWKNVAKLKAVVAKGYKPVIHTARPWTDYENIENWLIHYGIPFREIQCGKPLYALYIDDRARHADDDSWLP